MPGACPALSRTGSESQGLKETRVTPTVGRGRSSRRTVGGTCPDGSWVLQRPGGSGVDLKSLGHDPTVAEATKNRGESFGSLVVAMATGKQAEEGRVLSLTKHLLDARPCAVGFRSSVRLILVTTPSRDEETEARRSWDLPRMNRK